MLLAVDPGQNSPGVALFDNAGDLFRAGRVPIPARFAEYREGHRWLSVASTIVRWLCSESGINHVDDRMISEVAFEKPQWYQRGRSKGDPNQLVGIAGVAANVTGILSTHHEIAVHSPTPADWIGQLSKECPDCKYRRGALKGTGVRTLAKNCKNCRGSAWETPRGRYIRKRLQSAELALVPDQNDAIDAVGIGLWALGRLTPYQVFSNGRDGR